MSIYGLPAHIGPKISATIGNGASGPAAAARHARPWLITMVDLITLLLTFFVLMFSMSHVEFQRFAQVAQSYGEAFGLPADDPTGGKLPKVTSASGDDLAYLQAVLKASFASSPALKDIEFRLTPQYLMLTLPVSGLFTPGSGGFSEAAQTPVFDLSGVLSNLKNRIAVVGTAVVNLEDGDSTPAWTLAITRAKAMADALTASGYDQTVTVLGRGAEATDVGAALGRLDIMIMPESPVASAPATPVVNP